ncbi:MAG: L-2-hydroxyglutarate oxidase [Chloroflexi bacterium]|nr:MAG: L-2-hydroxyglutarate oxidase [Chloroflexota bacterium]
MPTADADAATRYDVAVIGAGILGLATARELARRGERRILVIDKERTQATHQTGHNSGVIHSGLYYTPGSAKARLCVAGRHLLLEFCNEQDIAHDICGKLVVAVEESELAELQTLYERGIANGLRGLRLVDAQEIREIEPAVRGLRAIWVPEAGIVNYRDVALAIARDTPGVTFGLGARVIGLRVTSSEVEIQTTGGTARAENVIACAGLHSDRIARMTGAAPEPRIIPFRGDYWVLKPERRGLIRGLVYPVPDSRFPFLGIHFTRRIEGPVWCGPNAVLAFAREGYRRRDVDLGDLAEAVGYGGFRALAAKYWRTGLAELARDLSKRLFLDALRRYVPELTANDLLPGPSGVRAQAIDREGRLVDDFAFDTAERVLNVRNAPSPAATSSLALAKEFVDRLERMRSGMPAPA